MSNAELIAEARSFRAGCDGAEYLELRLADALEAANAKLLLAYSEGFSEGFERSLGRRPKFGEMRAFPGMNGIPVADA